MKDFHSDFEFFWDKITNGEPFAFARYADGEVMLMDGHSVGVHTQAYKMDKWSAPGGKTEVGAQLLQTLAHTEENYYYAISAPTDSVHDFRYLRDKIKQSDDKITSVNLWINGNYQNMLTKYRSLKRPVNLICNERADVNNFPFEVSELIKFPDNCVSFWESYDWTFLNFALNKCVEKNEELFFISCGPVSEIIIDHLYKLNPHNTYVDVGSSLDEFIHQRKTRPYMNSNTIYSQMISHF